MIVDNLLIKELLGLEDPNYTVEEVFGFSKRKEDTFKRTERKKKQTKIKFSFKVPRPKGPPSIVESSDAANTTKLESKPDASKKEKDAKEEVDAAKEDIDAAKDAKENTAKDVKEDTTKDEDVSKESAAKEENVAQGAAKEDVA